ncbi:MAG: hypothetical protein IJL21_04960 [Alphaproteobacteria bacterium]|nr:hypothetical protein [Alphaproteobacteria bacterium]
MKGFRLIFCVCLGIIAFGHAVAVDGDDTARAATRRAYSPATTAARAAPPAATPNQNATTRNVSTTQRTAATESRGAIQAPTAAPRTVSARTTPVTRPTVQNRPTTNITRRATNARTATASRTARAPRTNARTATPARVATNTAGAIVTNYTKCREIFYECMDEFCANKDANLRRCACSNRSNEFNDIKKQMTNVENKMLDFNQRLLLVNMDAEDVNAINTATEGEDAFYSTRDTTKSKRALDDIAKKLNAKFGDTDSGGGGLGAISLALNVDAAFDTVDSFMGIDTTTKSGVALYNAALPICHDIAREVCTDEEISLAQSGYQMQIEQDCNTVKKSYQAQVDQARAKVFESGALLDMSRLDAYQTRNSDDLLTCKRKMLEMLTDTTVCGAKMEKCLDMTGRYIDPTTGAAFLSVNLADLDNMITRPGVNQTWTSANSSGKFITFLNDRKKYLNTATEHCEDIADTVWDAFIEDALAQIKLAQTAKLEEIRQACTKLTAECLNSAADSIENFDARALSVFGIMADRTANTMCADVQQSCATLLSSTGDVSWGTGVHEIATDKTYDTVVSSCTQVGQNCIIQSCKSISGNFDLCDDIDFSPNRHAILERTACWGEVLNCVASAGDDAIMAIMDNLGKTASDTHKYAFYKELYGNANISPIEDICTANGLCDDSNAECAACRIAERIWGNCEQYPAVIIGTSADEQHNRIHMPQNGQSTLLSWFAINTGTARMISNIYQSDARSCVNNRCTADTTYTNSMGQQICLPDDAAAGNITGEGMYCPAPHVQMQIDDNLTNCCFSGSSHWHHTYIPTATGNQNNACCEGSTETIDGKTICIPQNADVVATLKTTEGTKYIVCVHGTNANISGTNTTGTYPNGTQITCNGRFVMIEPDTNNYTNPTRPDGDYQYHVSMVHYSDNLHGTPISTGPQNNWFIHYHE